MEELFPKRCHNSQSRPLLGLRTILKLENAVDLSHMQNGQLELGRNLATVVSPVAGFDGFPWAF